MQAVCVGTLETWVFLADKPHIKHVERILLLHVVLLPRPELVWTLAAEHGVQASSFFVGVVL